MSDTETPEQTLADRILAAAFTALQTLAAPSGEADEIPPLIDDATRITHNRDTELGETEPDGIDLVDGTERITERLTGADMCELTFTLQLARRRAAAESQGVTGLPLSTLRIAAQKAVLADPSFGGLAIHTEALDYTAGPAIGDQLGNLETATLDFIVQYSTAEGDPTQPGV